MAVTNPWTVVLDEGSRCFIRTAEERDAKEVVRHSGRVGGETPFLDYGEGEFFYTAKEQGLVIRHARAAPNSLVLVALVSEEIVGTLSLQGQLSERLKHGAWLGITVARDFWGTGLSRALMGAGLHWAEGSAALRVLYLLTHPENARAVGLFKSFGFEEQGRLKRMFRSGEHFEDALCMWREV